MTYIAMGSPIFLHSLFQLWHDCLDVQMRLVGDLLSADENVGGEGGVWDLGAEGVPPIKETHSVVTSPRDLQAFAGTVAARE